VVCPTGVTHCLSASGYYLASQGRDIRAIQDYLGHKNSQHTARSTAMTSHRFARFWQDEAVYRVRGVGTLPMRTLHVKRIRQNAIHEPLSFQHMPQGDRARQPTFPETKCGIVYHARC
jgi:hypothetical protein